MIGNFLQLLKIELPSESRYIALARGKNKFPETFKELRKWLKR